MSVNLSPLGGAGAQFFTNDGVPLTGGLLYTYLAGTSTPATTYTSSSGATALANPIVLDAAGRVPTGEIWLTDGINYKFVLKDSTDVLIATWDGLSGINSNFIAYTAQEETATATAGQTVFNLTLSYLPATNNLAVYVNGSNQIVNVNYTETDDNTVTFLTGLNVGDVVKFSTASPVATNAITSANVSYTAPGTGAVTTNVQAKLREVLSVTDYGAVGDGVTDDTDAFTYAQAQADYIYVPEGLNCKVDAGLDYWKFYGEGAVFEPSRQWTLNPFPQTGDMAKVYNPKTFGTYETAVGQSITINSGDAQLKTNTQVLGTNAQGLASTYLDRDHVAQYVSAAGYIPIVLGSGATYTATSVTGAGISTTDVLPGMIIDTLHTVPFTGIVESVSGSTATVGTWYDNTGAPGTPANGTGALVNPNNKIFGQNIVVSASGNGTTTGAAKFTGIEMDLFTGASASPITNTWGIDVVSAGGGYIDVGMQVRGKRNISYYSNNAGGAGLYGFKSDGDARGLSVSDATTVPIEVILGGAQVFNVGTNGTARMGQVFVRGDGATQCTTTFVNTGAAFTSTYGGLYYVTGFNVSGGTEAKFLLAVNNTGVGSVYASDATGLGITFQVSGQQLQIKTTTGTFQFYVFSMFV